MGVLLGETRKILLCPFQLVRAELAHALELHYVIQTEEVDALVVETEPAFSRAVLREAGEVLFSVVSGYIVFTRNIHHIFLAKAAEDLLRRIKLARLCEMRDVACVNE